MLNRPRLLQLLHSRYLNEGNRKTDSQIGAHRHSSRTRKAEENGQPKTHELRQTIQSG